jgi:hypothetical protein
MSLNKIFQVSIIALSTLSIFLCFLAIYYHPFTGDDFFNQNAVLKGSFIDYIASSYIGWSGRLFSFLVPGVFFLSESMWILYKFLVLPCFLLMSSCSFYLATKQLPWASNFSAINFLIFTAVLWLGLPVVGITVVWLSGSIYLWMSTITLLFLSFIYKIRTDLLENSKVRISLVTTILLFILAFFAGATDLQYIQTIFLLLLFWAYQIYKANMLGSLGFSEYFILLGFLLGVIVFFSAPGNFVRLEHSESLSLLSNLKQFLVFVFGSYFGVGVGDLGKSLWIGLLLILSLNSLKIQKVKILKSLSWFFLSVATLLPFLPLIYFAAPRVTFFTIILLVIGVQSLVHEKNKESAQTFKQFTAIIFLFLIAIDGFVGMAANRSLDYEVSRRMEIITKETSLGNKQITVPHLSTIPSRLTYILTPQQDEQFLQSMASLYEIESITLDDSKGAPKPRSLQSLKTLKRSL